VKGGQFWGKVFGGQFLGGSFVGQVLGGSFVGGQFSAGMVAGHVQHVQTFAQTFSRRKKKDTWHFFFHVSFLQRVDLES
jgi:hypothetical protein